jgi:hypothetical protein
VSYFLTVVLVAIAAYVLGLLQRRSRTIGAAVRNPSESTHACVELQLPSSWRLLEGPP